MSQLAGAAIMDTLCDIQRARLSQDATAGTDYDFDNPVVVASGVGFSIQSVKPAERELLGQRDNMTPHKLYSVDPQVAAARQGDRVVDKRFTPQRYYILESSPEDMAGRGIMWGVFAWLLQ